MDVQKESVATEETGYGKIIRKAAEEVIFALLGLLVGLARLPFGAVPFGFALLGAAGRHTLAIFLGVCLSALLGGDGLVFLGAYALTLALRIVFGLPTAKDEDGTYTVGGLMDRLFGERASFRIISAAAGAFLVGLLRLIDSGFLYYDLFGTLLSVAVAAASAFLWRALPGIERGQTGIKNTVLQAAAFLTACGAVVYALRDWSPYGVSMSALVCMLVTLAVTRKKGIAFGALTAIFAGLAVSVTYAPLFVFAAVCYGFLSAASSALGCFSAFGVGMAWAIYMDGIGSLTSLLPALMGACLLFFVADKLFPRVKKRVKEESETVSAAQSATKDNSADIAIARLDDAAKKIKALCEGLSAISDTLLASNVYTPAPPQGFCAEDYSAEFGEEGIVAKSGAIPIKSGKKYTDMSDEIKQRMELYGHDISVEERTEARALDLRAISDYLADIMTGNDAEYAVDIGLGKAVTDSLLSTFPASRLRACVLGDGRKRVLVTADDARFLETNAEGIRQAVANACGFAVTVGEPLDIGGGSYLTFYQRPILDAVFAGKKKNSVHEAEYCGDSFGVIKDGDSGKMFAFISDGMGSGKEAAITSGLCTLFLQKLLPVNSTAHSHVGSESKNGGEWVRTTIEMLNGFLRSRGGSGERECSATVDLGVFDLVDCRAGFYKSGAAPTYVFRDGSLFKLRSRTVPVGIVKEPDVGRINMELLPGDVIVMVSDGVTGGREECPGLFEALRSRIMTHTAEQLAEAVVAYAEENASCDDISVLVIKIEEKVFER